MRGNSGELLAYAVLMIVEPPCAAVLDLSRNAGSTERARERVEPRVIGGIETVKHSARKCGIALKHIKKAVCISCGIGNADRIKARIGSERTVGIAVRIPLTAEVDLHDPAAARVFGRAEGEHICLVFFDLFAAQLTAAYGAAENIIDIGARRPAADRTPHTVVGGAAADALERATIHGEEYLSIEELQQASGVGSGILDRLRQVGALGDLPESSQVSFF